MTSSRICADEVVISRVKRVLEDIVRYSVCAIFIEVCVVGGGIALLTSGKTPTVLCRQRPQ